MDDTRTIVRTECGEYYSLSEAGIKEWTSIDGMYEEDLPDCHEWLGSSMEGFKFIPLPGEVNDAHP